MSTYNKVSSRTVKQALKAGTIQQLKQQLHREKDIIIYDAVCNGITLCVHNNKATCISLSRQKKRELKLIGCSIMLRSWQSGKYKEILLF